MIAAGFSLFGDHQVPVRSEDADELAQCPRQVGDMAQCDRANDQIDGTVGERDVVQVCLVKLAGGDLLAGDAEHLGRCVDADHPVAERFEVAVWRPVPQAASRATPVGRLSRISRTTGCSRSRS
jgi:hypothetical protein